MFLFVCFFYPLLNGWYPLYIPCISPCSLLVLPVSFSLTECLRDDDDDHSPGKKEGDTKREKQNKNFEERRRQDLKTDVEETRKGWSSVLCSIRSLVLSLVLSLLVFSFFSSQEKSTIG